MRTPSPRRPLPLLAALLLAGCAGPAGDPATPEPPVPATASTAAPVAPATQPDADQRPAVRVIASGRVEAGGGPGCLLLATDQGRTWLLVGGDRAVLAAGARVRVVGEPAPARTAGCQQGEPLRVRDATPAG
ncbi:MAG TPA: DUF5818 domain-containing protein [Actinomycetota bacterium]|jgi:hypothetical protein|nr:DUF5818 domain-containing protein [Actinomycetota bacterium]